jgi:glycosyltransferase involved in cell wall biosynthesis
VVTVSQWTKNIAIKYYGIDPEKIEVVHNGIMPKKSTPAPVLSSRLGSHYITFLGRITHQKGPLYFVEAARRVHEQFPEAHFIVAGSGDQLPIMIERIAQLRLSDKFHFTGFLKGDDIDRIWAMSSVYVMPSVSEPFGIAPLEAIQAGVPVIISNQAGVAEVMPHAIKADFWNTEGLAESICNVLRFKSLANTLKKNGAEQIQGITWDKAAKKLTALYYELTTKHEKPEKSRLLFSGSSTHQTAHPAVL